MRPTCGRPDEDEDDDNVSEYLQLRKKMKVSKRKQGSMARITYFEEHWQKQTKEKRVKVKYHWQLESQDTDNLQDQPLTWTLSSSKPQRWTRDWRVWCWKLLVGLGRWDPHRRLHQCIAWPLKWKMYKCISVRARCHGSCHCPFTFNAFRVIGADSTISTRLL